MRILKKSIIWIITAVYLIVAFGFVGNHYEEQLCNRIKITVKDSVNIGLLNASDIAKMIDQNNIKYLGVPLCEIDLEAIEKVVSRNQLIEECKAYTGINGSLHIEIIQRQPLARIIEAGGRSYYIDQKGNILNLSSHYSPHILVINGRFSTSLPVGKPLNVLRLGESGSGKLLRDIFELATYIESHELWNAQIVQVYVNNKHEFELVPRVGPHIIVLGTLDGYQEKFNKLELFYKEGLNNIGWNQYIKINLKYKDQIVCSKI